MSRIGSLTTALTVGLLAWPTSSSAQIYGGGSVLVEYELGNNHLSPVKDPPVFSNELGTFNAGGTPPDFIYAASSSAAGRNAVLQNDESCNVKKIGYGFSYPHNLPGLVVAYGNSDVPLTPQEINFWSAGKGGANNLDAGNLIQIPFLGTGLAFAAQGGKITGNGVLALTDNDLCGIFSGLLKTWTQIAGAGALGKANIRVAYHLYPGSGTLIMTSHFSAVCNQTNSAFKTLPVKPTIYFANLFPPGKIPANFTGQSDGAANAAFLNSNPGAIGYLPPDGTNIVDPFSTLYAAKVNGALPDIVSIANGLANPGLDTINPSPPKTAEEAGDPTKWVHETRTVTKGYPVVGYTNIVLPQCFSATQAHMAIEANLVAFLTSHYTDASYAEIYKAYDFVAVPPAFLTAIKKFILNPAAQTGINVAGKGGCAAYPGR